MEWASVRDCKVKAKGMGRFIRERCGEWKGSQLERKGNGKMKGEEWGWEGFGMGKKGNLKREGEGW